jgi:hypothetical protein
VGQSAHLKFLSKFDRQPLDPHITDFYNAQHPSQQMNQFRCSSGSSDPRGGTRMAVKKKPGMAAPKSKPRLKSTMKKKATKKTTKKK